MTKDTWVWTYGSDGHEYFVELSKITLVDEALMYVADWGVGSPLYRFPWFYHGANKLLFWLDGRREVAMRIPISEAQVHELGWPDDDDEG